MLERVCKDFDMIKVTLFFVAKLMENNLIYNCHDKLGHVRVDKAVEYLKCVYGFTRIKEVKSYILFKMCNFLISFC